MLADAHISSLGYLCWEGKIRIKKIILPRRHYPYYYHYSFTEKYL